MIHRRQLLQGIAWAGAFANLASGDSAADSEAARSGGIVDTHVHLFRWPFRRLPLDQTPALVKKLRELGVRQAWAGSYDALLHRDVTAVNARLVAECLPYEELIPVGTLNLSLPGWETDLRRCVDAHQMHAVRIYPGYHGYTLSDPRFRSLLRRAAKADLLVQIAVTLEDARTQHPRMRVPEVDLAPLADLVSQTETSKVQLLGARLRGAELEKLADTPGILFDTSRVEATDGIATLLDTVPIDRVMLGSHAPFLVPESALIRVAENPLSDKQRRSVLGITTRDLKSNDAKSRPGLPSADKLSRYRTWDSYFTPAHSHPGDDGSSRLVADIERSLPAIKIGQFEKLTYFAHVGLGTTTDPTLEAKLRARPELITLPLRRWPDLLIGMIQLNAHHVDRSLAAIDRWLDDGPMRGVYFPGGGPAALTCTHPNFDPLVDRITALGGVIMQHTWFKTGGKQGPGESTPSELAELARRHPQQQFIAAHAGGEWERGLRAVRDVPNIVIETSGFDATAGFIEMAVREVGADRIVFGSHLPSRSLGTELGKIVGANVSEHDKRLILGENYRRLLGAD